MRTLVISLVLLVAPVFASSAYAQTASLRVEVRREGTVVPGASVVVNGTAHKADEHGVAILELPPGTVEIVVVKEGLAPASVTVELGPGDARTVTIELQPQAQMEERVTVAATRTDKRISTARKSKRS